MTATKSNQDQGTAVKAFLLQRHQTSLYQLIVTRIFCRLACIATVGFVVLVNYFSPIQAAASASVAYLVTALWHFERRALGQQLTRLEQALAQQSGDVWEDIYIKSRYEASDRIGARFRGLEPMLWFYLILLLTALRLLLERSKIIAP